MQKLRASGILAAIVLLGLLVWTHTALAQGGDRYPPGVDPDEVYAISHKLYCDVCQGVPLSDCPTDQCRVWREEIGDLLARGRSENQVRQHFADRYGDKVSGVPINSTSRLLTYGIMLVTIGLVTVGIGWQVYQWRGRESRALLTARQAGTLEADNRPIPDNVDPIYLERVLKALEQHNT